MIHDHCPQGTEHSEKENSKLWYLKARTVAEGSTEPQKHKPQTQLGTKEAFWGIVPERGLAE